MWTDRRFYLKLMIGALIATALCGMLAVVAGSWDFVGRIMGSAFVAAVAAALMIPLSGWVDDQAKRVGGLAGMGLVVVQFVLVLGNIWGGWLFGRWEFPLALTALALVPTGWIAVGALRAAGGRTPTMPTWVLLATCAATLALWVAAIWVERIVSGVSYKVEDQLGGTGATVMLYGLTAAAALSGWKPKLVDQWRCLGAGAAAVACLIVTIAIWMELRESNGVVEWISGVAAYVALVNLLIKLPLTPGQHRLRVGLVIVAGAAVALTCYSVVHHDDRYYIEQSLTPRLAVGLLIATFCGSLVCVILARMNRGVNLEPQAGLPTTVDLACPRCRERLHLPLGDAACPKCRLRISIKIEEPRCVKCGYLLYVVTTDACPECGTPISQSVNLVSRG